MQCGENRGKKICSARLLVGLAGAFARISSVTAPMSKQTAADSEKKA